jgi:hypothetical protein
MQIYIWCRGFCSWSPCAETGDGRVRASPVDHIDAKRNLCQPCHHSRFHAALPCNTQRMLPAPQIVENNLQPLKIIRNMAGMGSALPAILENHPANRKLQGKPALGDRFDSDCVLHHMRFRPLFFKEYFSQLANPTPRLATWCSRSPSTSPTDDLHPVVIVLVDEAHAAAGYRAAIWRPGTSRRCGMRGRSSGCRGIAGNSS